MKHLAPGAKRNRTPAEEEHLEWLKAKMGRRFPALPAGEEPRSLSLDPPPILGSIQRSATLYSA